ncbi:MAG: PaREP1 family protein [Desulfurococcales archaeon]|jgi:HEPN domain-containing protein|nr:PaREP1 family protein [Desulfurococcales archaeon]
MEVKARLNIAEIAESRLQEALKELDMAWVFLKEGLVRNAAGKAFQAWKSILSYLALRNLELLESRYRGFKRVGSRSIPLHEWIAAVMPTNRMAEASTILEDKVRGVIELTALALQLHEFQYNGPDPEGIRSKIPNEETAKDLVKTLLERIREIIRSLEK